MSLSHDQAILKVFGWITFDDVLVSTIEKMLNRSINLSFCIISLLNLKSVQLNHQISEICANEIFLMSLEKIQSHSLHIMY